ncbi:MAG: homoserine O-succinyltransferase [Candidatus Marinimicrobia bacterium]|nr:homoserine O-succinyltransferase [Candidatus Neomarinimicrobiota bacterium]
MPLVAHQALPTYDYLIAQGQEVLNLGSALHQDIRELHIGFLNLMPDAAFTATEKQFLRLVGSSNQIVQYYIYPFTIPEVKRSDEIQKYIDTYYTTFEDLKRSGLDALIITGTNPANASLDQEPFWEPLRTIVDWATKDTTSVLCSCLAVHAIVKHLHNIERQPLERKRWGVYSHRISNPIHPLLRDINTRFDVPHSRNNDVSPEQLKAAGFKILVEGEESGVHMAVSPDMFRIVFLQGHPEYDRLSLLKEYKREVTRYFMGERENFPESPENYFNTAVEAIIDDHKVSIETAKSRQEEMPPFPETEIAGLLDNTWRDTGKSIFNNWLGMVYQLTNVDRHLPFADGVDPEDPLKLKAAYSL